MSIGKLEQTWQSDGILHVWGQLFTARGDLGKGTFLVVESYEVDLVIGEMLANHGTFVLGSRSGPGRARTPGRSKATTTPSWRGTARTGPSSRPSSCQPARTRPTCEGPSSRRRKNEETWWVRWVGSSDG